MKKQLLGHYSIETAYVVDNYPYGFRLRTKIRYWVETTKRGQRAVSQTLNPKTGRWNKPKKTTYSDITVMGLDEKGHVAFDGITAGVSEKDLDRFLATYKLETNYQKKQVDVIRAWARVNDKVTWTIVRDEGQPRQSLEEQREILTKLARHEYVKIKRGALA